MDDLQILFILECIDDFQTLGTFNRGKFISLEESNLFRSTYIPINLKTKKVQLNETYLTYFRKKIWAMKHRLLHACADNLYTLIYEKYKNLPIEQPDTVLYLDSEGKVKTYPLICSNNKDYRFIFVFKDDNEEYQLFYIEDQTPIRIEINQPFELNNEFYILNSNHQLEGPMNKLEANDTAYYHPD